MSERCSYFVCVIFCMLINMIWWNEDHKSSWVDYNCSIFKKCFFLCVDFCFRCYQAKKIKCRLSIVSIETRKQEDEEDRELCM